MSVRDVIQDILGIDEKDTIDRLMMVLHSNGYIEPEQVVIPDKIRRHIAAVQDVTQNHIVYDHTITTRWRYIVVKGEVNISCVQSLGEARQASKKKGCVVYDSERKNEQIKPPEKRKYARRNSNRIC